MLLPEGRLVRLQVEVCAVRHAPKLTPAEREQILEVGRRLGIVRQLFRLVVAQTQMLFLDAQTLEPLAGSSCANSRTTPDPSPGMQKNSSSICSNSRMRKMKLPGVISFRKLLPTWHTPNGSLRRVVRATFGKLTKMPCAVSGRR